MNLGETPVEHQISDGTRRPWAARPDLPAAPDVASALSTAALVALRAPSVHHTQPWHWRIRTGRLELYADHRWQLPVADPDGRMLGLSCGAALHYVRTALRAMGYLPSVRRIPDSGHPDLLAEVTVAKPIPVTEEAVALVRATSVTLAEPSRSSRGPTVPAIAALRRAAASEGAWLHMLRGDQVHTLLAAAERSENLASGDNLTSGGPGFRRAAASWTDTDRYPTTGGATGTGLHRTRLPRTGLPRTGDGHQALGSYGLLYGSGDRPVHWLRAGEALSAVWLTATRYGLAAQPLSAVTEVPAGRTALQHMLLGTGNPYLALRIGAAGTGKSGETAGPSRNAEDPVGATR